MRSGGDLRELGPQRRAVRFVGRELFGDLGDPGRVGALLVLPCFQLPDLFVLALVGLLHSDLGGGLLHRRLLTLDSVLGIRLRQIDSRVAPQAELAEQATADRSGDQVADRGRRHRDRLGRRQLDQVNHRVVGEQIRDREHPERQRAGQRTAHRLETDRGLARDLVERIDVPARRLGSLTGEALFGPRAAPRVRVGERSDRRLCLLSV